MWSNFFTKAKLPISDCGSNLAIKCHNLSILKGCWPWPRQQRQKLNFLQHLKAWRQATDANQKSKNYLKYACAITKRHVFCLCRCWCEVTIGIFVCTDLENFIVWSLYHITNQITIKIFANSLASLPRNVTVFRFHGFHKIWRVVGWRKWHLLLFARDWLVLFQGEISPNIFNTANCI